MFIIKFNKANRGDAILASKLTKNIFDVDVNKSSATVHLLPVPWDVTTSYGKGTRFGPEIMFKASCQVDLFDYELKNAFEAGYFMKPIPKQLLQWNRKAQAAIKNKKLVNKYCAQMVEWVYQNSQSILDEGKILGVIGGDHSVPEGAIKALSHKFSGDFSILHIDAHADLRHSYQGFKHSHASIMNNVMSADWAPKKLVQIGIRDFCEEEYDFINSHQRIKTFFDFELKAKKLSGTPFSELCDEIIAELSEKVYVSFDIDGMEPIYCPNTGTPVAGGFNFDEIVFLFSKLLKAKKKLIGFDLVEVSSGPKGLKSVNEWDANVGARMLFKLCGYATESWR
jgi:agmatinase